jgi:hypothetical protein
MGMVSTIVFVEVLMTDTLLLISFVTYAVLPFDDTAIPYGLLQTVMLVTTVFVNMLMTDNMLLPGIGHTCKFELLTLRVVGQSISGGRI